MKHSLRRTRETRVRVRHCVRVTGREDNESWLEFCGRYNRGGAGDLGASIFTVDQRQHAIVFQLGEIREVIAEPGLYFKWPMIQNVRYFDKRILTLDSPDPERFITSEKKNVLVDSFVKWKIVDPKLYYISVAGDEARAKTRLSQTVNAGLREELASALFMMLSRVNAARSWSTVVKGDLDAQDWRPGD